MNVPVRKNGYHSAYSTCYQVPGNRYDFATDGHDSSTYECFFLAIASEEIPVRMYSAALVSYTCMYVFMYACMYLCMYVPSHVAPGVDDHASSCAYHVVFSTWDW